MHEQENNRWWRRIAVLTVVATFGLVCLGGLVTSHGVGMAVPDWPNTYGYNMFFFPVSQWVGGVFFEHSHRLAGSLVGFLTLVLALSLHGHRGLPVLRSVSVVFLAGGAIAYGLEWRQARWAELAAGVGAAGLMASLFWPHGPAAPLWLRRLGLLAVALVLFQGVLGGLRVVLIQDWIGIIHALLAQLFLVLVCIIAWGTSPRWATPCPRSAARLRFWVTLATLTVLVQLGLGAAMRHRHAGLAVPDFPLAYGRLWPATDPASMTSYNQNRPELAAVNALTTYDVHLHMAHRLHALVVVGLILAAALSARKHLGAHRNLTRVAAAWVALVCLQAVLGAATVWSNKSADLATAHVAVGALTLVMGSWLTLVAWRASWPRPGSARSVPKASA